ncbi:MAG: hypothetical protein GC151_12090 [Betaproteobacteria bacterium]|nr:hypothetical protein [Betaproteobacteria bacterium]
MNERSLGGLPITGWLGIVLAVVGVLVWKQAPLDPNRATGSEVPQTQLRALQDVSARLWEDPFTALARARADMRNAGVAEQESARSIETVCDQLVASSGDSTFHLHVIAAMVSNAPYADGDESRRRVRYATVSALNVAHFVPENADHLGYFRWNGTNDVPFEAFRRKNTRGDKFFALVLWLEDEVVSWTDVDNPSAQSLDGRPLHRLAQLRDQVRHACIPGSARKSPQNFTFSVLGPANSQTLRTMTRELQAQGANAAAARRAFGEPFDIYSAFATAPAKEIMGSSPPPGEHDACTGSPDPWYCRLGMLFRQHGIRFHRVNATDNAAAQVLVEELERRGVHVKSAPADDESRHHVAIVSEWDTYYGRRLPVVFLRAAGLEAACETDPSEHDAEDEAAGGPPRECRVVRFSYLRGLDGEGPRSASASKSASKAGDESTPRGTATEPAEGYSQFDYLRRLAARIERENDRLKRAGRGEIGAIGVLGSDVYDKIAVLRALRPSFPRAVFFTTDLDARLLRAEQLEWTRNLIVASGFGFALSPCLQKDVPPFRGTYQTAAFFGVRVALFNAMPADSPYRGTLCPEHHAPDTLDSVPPAPTAKSPERITSAALDGWLATPRLFELGRTGAVSLDGPAAQCLGLDDCGSVHPTDSDAVAGTEKFLWGCAAAGAFFLLLVMISGTRPIVMRPFLFAVDYLGNGTQSQRVGVLFVLAAVIGPPIWVILRGLASIGDPGGEPFFWAEGVSVWPSELLRLVALTLGVCFLVYAFSELHRSADRLATRFDLEGGTDLRTTWRVALGWFGTRKNDVGTKGRAAQLWAQYRRSGHLFWRLARSFAWVVLFYLGAAVMFHLTERPNNPARGLAAMQVEGFLRITVVFVFLFLLFAVNDAIRLCTRFLRELTASRETNDWSPGACREFGEALGLPATLQPAARDKVLDAWIDTRFAARLTADVGLLIYFPFVIFAFLLAARWHVVDAWDLAPGLVVVLAAGFVLACVNAVEMQRAASRARHSALWRLNDMVIRASGGADKDYPGVQSLQTLVRMIETLREGAFVPFVEQPLVRAALIPFSSAGGLYLIDLFSLAN